MSKMDELKARLASSTAIVKPDWYNGSGDNDWSQLDSETKQMIVDNPDDDLVKAMASNDDAYLDDAGNEVPADDADADVDGDGETETEEHHIVTDATVATLEAAVASAAAKVDKAAITALEQGADDNEKAKRMAIVMASHVSRLFGKDGRGRAGNQNTVPLVKSSEPDADGLQDIWFTQRMSKSKNELVEEEHSFWKEQFHKSFGVAINDRIVELQDQKASKTGPGEATLDQYLSQARARRDYMQEKWIDAVAYIQKAYIVNRCDNVRVEIGDDIAQRGNEPIIVSENKLGIDEKTGKERLLPAQQRTMSIATFLKFGTHSPITEDMSFDDFLKSAPPRKKRTANSGQGSNDNNTAGLAFPQVDTVDQFDGATAELAAACKNKELVAKLMVRMKQRDADGELAYEGLILSWFDILKTAQLVTKDPAFKAVYDASIKAHADADNKAAALPTVRKAS